MGPIKNLTCKTLAELKKVNVSEEGEQQKA